MCSRRTGAPIVALGLLALASSGVASASSLLSPFPIVQVTGKVAKGGTKLRRLTVISPAGSTVTAHCRGRGCPFRSKTYGAGGTIRVRKLEGRLLRTGVVIEISITSPDAIGKYTRLKVRKGKPPGRTDACLMPGEAKAVACPSTSPGSTFDISDGSVTTGKLADSAVTSAKLAADAVGAAAIAADAVTASEIASNSVGSDEIAADAVTSSEILDATVTTADISQSVWSGVHQTGTLLARPPAGPENEGYLYFATDVASGTLFRSDGASWVKWLDASGIPADGSITNPKLAADAVTFDKIAADTITAADIAAGAVGTSEIADSSITTNDIAVDTITAADIAAGAVTTSEILDATIASADIATDTITAGNIAPGAVATSEILDNTIASGDLSSTSGSEAVATGNIRDLAVTTPKLAAGAVTNAKLGTDAVTTGNITDGTIVAVDIADGAVNSNKIADSSITTTDIALDTIAAADIAAGAVTTSEILDATITSADIANGTIQKADLAAGAAGDSTYRLVENRSGKLNRDAGASTYILPAGGTTAANSIMESGVDLERDAGVFYLSAADYALTGWTTQLRLRATLLANSTAPGVTIKVGLYPVSGNTGGNDKNNVTVGTVVSGSEATFSSVSPDSPNVATSPAAFSFPLDGFYVIGVNTNGTLANNSLVDITADLQVRNV
jgi:hypothetical protein